MAFLRSLLLPVIMTFKSSSSRDIYSAVLIYLRHLRMLFSVIGFISRLFTSIFLPNLLFSKFSLNILDKNFSLLSRGSLKVIITQFLWSF